MSEMGSTAEVTGELAACRGDGNTHRPPDKRHRCSECEEGETCISLAGENSIVLASVFILNMVCWKFAFQKC